MKFPMHKYLFIHLDQTSVLALKTISEFSIASLFFIILFVHSDITVQ